MSEIKRVWGIIKDYKCADLKMVQDPALAVFQHQQAIIDNLKAQLNNMETCYIEKKKQVEGALHILDELYRKGLFKKPTAVSEAIKVLRGTSD